MSIDTINLVITEMSGPQPTSGHAKRENACLMPYENDPVLHSILNSIALFRMEIRTLTLQCMKGMVAESDYRTKLDILIENMGVAESTFRDILAGSALKHLI